MTRYLTATIAAVTFLSAQAAIPMRNPHVAALEPYTAPANAVPAPAQFTFMPDGVTAASLDADARKIVVTDLRTGDIKDTLLDLGHTRQVTDVPYITSFILSPDASKILISTEHQPIYRRSFSARWYVYEVRSRLLTPLSTNHPRQISPVFSPNSRMVAFGAPDNNIHIAKLDYGSEVDVTADGAIGKIINGIPDWTYEEEFATTSSMAWAPDNLTLAYIKYNEEAVPNYSLTLYGGSCLRDEKYALYPGQMEYKYPVAGQPNSTVSLHAYDIETRKTQTVALPDQAIEYIPRIVYAPGENRLLVCTLNRDQNRFELYSANTRSTVVKSLYVDTPTGWIDEEVYNGLVPEANGFVVTSCRSGYYQLYRYTYAGALSARMTDTETDVTAYLGTDAQGNVYYQSAAPTPKDRTISRRDIKGRVTTIGAASGTTSAKFSPGMKYLSVTYSDLTTPTTYTLCNADGKTLRTLADNSAYTAKTKALKASKEFVTIPGADGAGLNGYIVYPADFDASKKYPVIMSQYSGPGSQSVLNRWTLDWEDYFASQGFVIACFDGRGTGGRGVAFRTAVYRNLGHYETIDQVTAARYMASQPWVDPRRIGIYGWSYGGYEALMCAQASDSPYAAAVAIAPVTDWRLYDTVYTERYMLTPQQNDSGYNTSSAIRGASALGCPVLVMYGTLDDNVHPANSIEYISRLESLGILPDVLLFPNMNHSINGCNARRVVYARMLEYFSRYL